MIEKLTSGLALYACIALVILVLIFAFYFWFTQKGFSTGAKEKTVNASMVLALGAVAFISTILLLLVTINEPRDKQENNTPVTETDDKKPDKPDEKEVPVVNTTPDNTPDTVAVAKVEDKKVPTKTKEVTVKPAKKKVNLKRKPDDIGKLPSVRKKEVKEGYE